MSLEDFLGNRYRRIAHLPAQNATHQRYVVEGMAGFPGRAILSYSDYVKPLSHDALDKQRRVAEAMTRPPVALLCRVTEARLEAEYQIVVSEFPGDHILRELLQQRQALTIEEVEAFLRLLTEACEAAVALQWPKLQLDTGNLFLDPRLGLPRIPAPDIPLFENAGTDTPEFDPMATMQFNASDLRSAADPLPKDTREYVQLLAALCCDLLGQPQTLRGGNARYQPVPQLTSQQNVLLRRALTSEGRAGFGSAKAFIDEFYGISMHHSIAAHTERLRSLTATLKGGTGLGGETGVHSAHITVGHRMPVPPPLPHPEVLPASAVATLRQATPLPPPLPLPERPPGPVVAPLTVREGDREIAEAMPPTPRLRLVPDSDEAPVFALVSGNGLTLGRSAADADFVAQFRPRSNLNDGRSRRISRSQTSLTLKGSKVALEEDSAVNPSVCHDSPIPCYAELDLPASFLLAGEYPVDVRAMPTDYDHPREMADLPHKDEGRLDGAVIVRPGGAGVLLSEAALLFSDVGMHFSKSGRPWFRAESGTVPAARFHRIGPQFWLEPIEPSVIAVADGSQIRSKAHELVLLRDGVKLRVGAYGYTVQAYTPGGGEKGPGATSPTLTGSRE